jgi:hypothetical protein
MTGSMLQLSLDNKNKIPQFYFPKGNAIPELVELEDNIINQVFTREDVTMEEFLPITVELLGFPKLLNSVVFKKIAGDSKLTKKLFTK